MKTVSNKPVTDDERLSSDELDVLRMRLAEAGHLGQRLDGALTVHDLAETSGLDPSEVLAHLRQIRAERAFDTTTAKPKSQVGLLVLAAAMLGVAGMIYKLQPARPLTLEEAEARVKEIQAHRKIHYPVDKSVDLGDANPPQGFTLELDGRYVIVSTIPRLSGPVLLAPQAEVQLARSIEALAAAAQKVEQETPVPDKSVKLLPPGERFGGPRHPQGTPGYGYQGSDNRPLGGGEFELKEQRYGSGINGRITSPPTDAAALAAWKADIEARVKTAVQAKLDGQNQQVHYQDPSLSDRYAMPPPGFQFRFKGKNDNNFQSTTVSALPIDKEATIERLLKMVRVSIRRDHEPPQDFQTPAYKAEQIKKPIPAFSTVETQGPNNIQIKFDIPTERSAKYPTASDVVRGQEQAIAEFKRKLETAIDALNAGKVFTP